MRRINTGLHTESDALVLNSIFGQMSDGIWENSPRMEPYWKNADVEKDGDTIYLVIIGSYSPYDRMTDEDILKYFAQKAKQIVKTECTDNGGSGPLWNRSNTATLNYYKGNTTVQDVYRVYDTLLGRKSK